MTAHGAGLLPLPGARINGSLPNSRHLFGSVGAYGGMAGGIDAEATRSMLSKLAAHMMRPEPLSELPSGTVFEDENVSIPAGYTYFAQLVTHDLVHNALALPTNDGPTRHTRADYRTNRLVLDCIYGGGPDMTPLPYTRNASRPRRDYTLRLGYIREREAEAAGSPSPFIENARDIARARCPHLSDAPRDNTAPDALIADPRNDDNLILSQLAALLHEFHNSVYDKWCRSQQAGNASHAGPDQLARAAADERNFLIARRIAAYVYRRILVLDFLPRILEKDVYAYYLDQKRQYPTDWLDQDHIDSRVPLEFSHAAFRFGHVMVRFHYDLNSQQEGASIRDVLDRSSSRRSDLVPLAKSWLVDWSRFFDFGGASKTNHSRRIRPYIGGGTLAGSSFFPTGRGPNGEEFKGGLFYRDLMRGAEGDIGSVKSLIAQLKRKRPAEVDRSPLLADDSRREHLIGKWLKAGGGEDFTDREILSLSAEPPLFFFILFEAAVTQKGERLGVLGSTIVAEVLSAALKLSAGVIEDITTDTELHAIFGGTVPSAMPELIQLVEKWRRERDQSTPA